jgi:catechol 2,3-dioxygenase-like lactoylglutathione lyase family enzyme
VPRVKKLAYRFVYTGIRVSNLSRAVNFYTKVLGMKPYRKGKMPHGGKYVGLKSQGSEVELELNWYPKTSKYYAPFKPEESMDHLAFAVGKGNSELAFKQLIKRGAKPAVTLEESQGVCYPYVMDPEGNCIELLEWD